MKFKRIITTMLVFVLMFTIIPATQLSVSAKTNHSQAEAVQWITAKKNARWAEDYDYYAGAQCVDLIVAYFEYLAGYRSSGNAYQYANMRLPDGWTYASTPSPGDIAVWRAYKGIALSTGHVALVESVSGGSFYYVDINGANHTAGSGVIGNSDPSVFIHPDFSGSSSTPATPSVSFKHWSNGSYTFIGETNAAIGQEITVSNGSCGENGMVLYDANGNKLASAKNPTYTLARVYFDVNSEMGYTLTPGTNYQYKFYAVVNGKTYWSNMQSFKTGGNTPSTEPTVKFNPWSNGNYTFVGETNAAIGQEILVTNGSCGENGMYLYDANGTHLASGKNPTYTLARVYFDVNSEMGYTLKPGTKYQYKFYAVVNGKTYWSGMQSFKTAGTAPSDNKDEVIEEVIKTNTCLLMYNALGGNNAPAQQTQTENKYLTVSNKKPTKEGYNFVGWGTVESPTTPIYYGGESILMDNDITLYAVWEEIIVDEPIVKDETPEQGQTQTYWLFYDANGGVGAPAPVTEEERTSIVVTTKKPTRNGYNFIGWFENSNASVVEYESGSMIYIDRNITLYAVWEKMDSLSNDTKPSDWAAKEVEAAIKAGLVPENLQKNYTMPVYRLEVAGMFINIIEEVSGKKIDTILKNNNVSRNEDAFTDTNDSNVLAANALGIINGVGNNLFDSYGTLTRGEITAIINRSANVLGIRTVGFTHNFVDTKNHWCNNELGWASSIGIINGVGDNRFAPDEKLTTEQAIAIVYRAYQKMK